MAWAWAGDFGLVLALREQARRARRAQRLGGGLLACAVLLAAPTARADDSLWGKAMNSIGLGGNGASSQGAAAPQPAAPPPQPAPAAQAAQQPAPAPAAPGDNQNLLSNFFGWGHHNDARPTSQAAIQPQGKALTPVQAAPAPAPASEPGVWDRMLGNVGLNTNNPADNITYAERPKLNVPKARSLAQPAPLAAETGVRPSNPKELVEPPDNYLEKVRGADGNVSGLRSGDISKDKKFFGLF